MRFFTTEELRERRIPLSQHFEDTLSAIRCGFQNAYQQQGVKPSGCDFRKSSIFMTGAVVIGSLARGTDLRPTSDVDVLVFYENTNCTLENLLRFLENLRDNWTVEITQKLTCNVPINVYNVLSSSLTSGNTRHNTQFLGHAMRSIYGLPESDERNALLCGHSDDIRAVYDKAPKLSRESACMYTRGKFEKLLDAYATFGALSEERHVHALANAVNAPFHAARQVLDVSGKSYTDTKLGVITACKEIGFPSAEGLLEIRAIADKYNEDIIALLDGSTKTLKVDEQRLITTALFVLEDLQNKLQKP